MRFILTLLLLIGITLLSAQKKITSIVTLPDTNPVFDFSLSKDSSSLFYFANNNIIEYNLLKDHTAREMRTSISSPVISLVILPCENKALVGTKSGTIRLLDLNDESEISQVKLNAGSINSIVLIQNGEFCLCGTASGTIYKCRILDLSDYQVFHQLNSEVTQIKTFPSDSLITAIDGAGYLYSYDLITLESLQYIKVSKKWLRTHDYNSSKNLLLIGGDDGYIYTYKLKSNRRLGLISKRKATNNWVTTIGYSQSGKLECWGTMGHKLYSKSAFTTLSTKLKGPVIKAAIVTTESKQVIKICSVYGSGITIVPLYIMKNIK